LLTDCTIAFTGNEFRKISRLILIQPAYLDVLDGIKHHWGLLVDQHHILGCQRLRLSVNVKRSVDDGAHLLIVRLNRRNYTTIARLMCE
jgi:hypothetical protein